MNKYLLDTVSLSKIGISFLKQYSNRGVFFITDEIDYEISTRRDYLDIVSNIITLKTEVDTLKIARNILKSLSLKESVIDLYRNEGNGDVSLIAHAMEQKSIDEKGFGFNVEWIIVTDDNGLRDFSKNFGIKTLKTEDFLKEF